MVTHRPSRYEDKLHVWAIKLIVPMIPFIITFVAGYEALKSDLQHAEISITELKADNKELLRRIEVLQFQMASQSRQVIPYYPIPQSEPEPPVSHNEKQK